MSGVASDFNETAMLIPRYVNGREIVGIDLTANRDLTSTVTSISIPDSVKYIGANSFSETNVKEVVLPDSVISIGDGAFHLKGATTYNKIDEYVLINDAEAKAKEGVTYYEKVAGNYQVKAGLTVGSDSVTGYYLRRDVKAEAGVTYYEKVDDTYQIKTGLTVGESSVVNLYVNPTRLDVYFNGTQSNGDPIAIGTSAFALDEGTTYLHTAAGVAATGYVRDSSTIYVLVDTEGAKAEAGVSYYELNAGAFILKENLEADISVVTGYYRRYDYAIELVSVTDASGFVVETVKGREIAVTALTEAGLAESEIILPTYLNGRKVTTLADGAFSHATKLEKLTLPKYLNEIGAYVFTGTFENITNMSTEFLLFEGGSSDVFDLATAGGEDEIIVLYNKAHSAIYAAFSVRESLKEGFEGSASDVEEYVLPESVTEIREGALSGLYSVRKFTGNETFRADAKQTVLIRVDEEQETATVIAVLRTCANFSLSTENVNRIGAYAFYKNEKLKNVSGIPVSVNEFGVGAFEGCVNMTSVGLPTIESVPARMFKDCASLTSVNLPAQVREIGAFAFSGSGLQAIAFPAQLADIGDYSFAGCEKLTKVDFTGTIIRSIGDYAFKDCVTLGEIELGTVTELGTGAFMNTGVTSITLPSGVTEIAPSLFEGATKLTDVTTGTITAIGASAFKGTTSFFTVPNGLFASLKTLGEGAFEGSGLRSVQIPQGVTVIPARAFKNCKYLTSVTFTSAVRSIGEEAFYGCDGKIALDNVQRIEVSGGKVTLVRRYDSENEEEQYAEERETVITTTVTSDVASTVVAGYKIRAVGDKIVVDNRIVGNAAVDENNNLYRFATVGDLRIELRKVSGAYVLSITSLNEMDLGKEKLNVSFGVTKANLGIRISEIGARAFAYSSIESINLTDSVEVVGDEAFAYNDSLQSVLIGSKLREIGSGVFRGTPNLTGIDVSKKNTHFKSDDDKVLYMLDQASGTWILKLYPAGRIPEGDLSYTIPAGVSGIDEGAFDGCKLERIVVREGVSVIKKGAFANAGSLKTIFFDDNLVIDDASVFEGTTVELDVPMYGSLEAFCYSGALPEGVTFKLHTPKSCFEYRTGDSTAKIVNLKTELAYDYSELVIPDYIDGCRVTKIESLALANAGIESLTLPLLVDEIGAGALFGNRLSEIVLLAEEVEKTEVEYVANEENEEPTMVTRRTVTADNGTFVLTKYEVNGVAQYATLINKIHGEFLYYLDGDARAYDIPDDVTTIGYGAFYRTELRTVDLSGVSVIQEAAFLDAADLTTVNGADGVQTIGARAFENCRQLAALDFGEGLYQIGGAAFAGSGLTSITFGGETDNGWFHYERYVLKESGNELIGDTVGGILYAYDDSMTKTMILHTVFNDYVDGYDGSVFTTPNSFEQGDFVYSMSGIGAYAFKGADYTGMVVVLPEVKDRSIVLYEGALLNDTIKEVHFEGRVTCEKIAADYFADDTLIYYPQGSGLAGALENNEKATAVTLKDYLLYDDEEDSICVYGLKAGVSDLVIPVYIDAKKVTTVGREEGSSFGNVGTLCILDNVTTLAPAAFKNCAYLKSVILGKGVTVIPESAFEGCGNLSSVTMAEEVTKIGAKAFKNTVLTELPVVVKGGVSFVNTIGAEAFRGNRYLTSLSFWNPKDGNLTIGDYAFADCNNSAITMINLPSWVRLGKGVFYSETNYIQYLLVEGDLWENGEDVDALIDLINTPKHDDCIVNIWSTRFAKVSIPMDA